VSRVRNTKVAAGVGSCCAQHVMHTCMQGIHGPAFSSCSVSSLGGCDRQGSTSKSWPHLLNMYAVQPMSTGMMTYPFCWGQIFILLLLILYSEPTLGLQVYLTRSPNGNSIGGGLGHTNLAGGGSNNAYGSAFASQNYQWTRTLCLEGT
jgi:hypothetical protein